MVADFSCVTKTGHRSAAIGVIKMTEFRVCENPKLPVPIAGLLRRLLQNFGGSKPILLQNPGTFTNVSRADPDGFGRWGCSSQQGSKASL